MFLAGQFRSSRRRRWAALDGYFELGILNRAQRTPMCAGVNPNCAQRTPMCASRVNYGETRDGLLVARCLIAAVGLRVHPNPNP